MNKFDTTYNKIKNNLIQEGVVKTTLAGGALGALGMGIKGANMMKGLGTPGKIIGALAGGTIGTFIGLPIGLACGIVNALKEYAKKNEDERKERDIQELLATLKQAVAEKQQENEGVIKEAEEGEENGDDVEFEAEDVIKAALLLAAFKQMLINAQEAEEAAKINKMLSDLKAAVDKQ